MAIKTKSYVARIDAVKASISELSKFKVHPHFASYLSLLRASLRYGKTVDHKNESKEFFETFFAVPGGSQSPYKPYFRPFWNRSIRIETWLDNCWCHEGITGSFTPSSVRPTGLPAVADLKNSGQNSIQSLKPNHPQLALTHLLKGKQLPVVPLALFLYRDYALVKNTSPEPGDLVVVFREEFGFSGTGAWGDDKDFQLLFTDDSAQRKGEDLFEEFK